jgi:predicted small metal-binding protein
VGAHLLWVQEVVGSNPTAPTKCRQSLQDGLSGADTRQRYPEVFRTVLAREWPMKRFACGDVVPGCQAQWVCPTDDEILTAVARHAALDHGMAEVPAEVVAQVRSKITTVV